MMGRTGIGKFWFAAAAGLLLLAIVWVSLHAATWPGQDFGDRARRLLASEGAPDLAPAATTVMVGTGKTRIVCVSAKGSDHYVVTFTPTLFGTTTNEVYTPGFRRRDAEYAWHDMCSPG